MGAVFTSAARAPLTSVASVVELTGAYGLTLPVMLAVAIATALSRALAYGSIYTTKLLRRGTDIDRAAPWRAFADLRAADAMHPFPVPLAVPRGRDGADDGADTSPRLARLPGTVSWRANPQPVYASESLAQALRQLGAWAATGCRCCPPTATRCRAGSPTPASCALSLTRSAALPARAAARPGRSRPTRCTATRSSRSPWPLGSRGPAARQHPLAQGQHPGLGPARPHCDRPRPGPHPERG
ncbi:MAG: chloride channel protein [Streptosporangiaceae bacterium]